MKIVAATSSSTTARLAYLAAEALRSTAEEMGHQIRVEAKGPNETFEPLTEADIAAADVAILVMDVPTDFARFAGKLLHSVSISEAIYDPRAVVDAALNLAVAPPLTVLKNENAARSEGGEGLNNDTLETPATHEEVTNSAASAMTKVRWYWPWRGISSDQVTFFMALLGVAAFAWQVKENVGARTEVLNVETGDPVITSQGFIRLPVSVINLGQVTVYVRSVELTDNSGKLLVSFRPNSVEKMEAGEIRPYTAATPILAALQINQSSDLILRIKTTREIHQHRARYVFSAATINTIATAAGQRPPTLALDSTTASELRAQIEKECGALKNGRALALWRDMSTGQTVLMGDPAPGQAFDVVCTPADSVDRVAEVGDGRSPTR
ncbi:MAG: PTS fructose transporter subunit IIB [Longimicrobiaceae bacterium]